MHKYKMWTEERGQVTGDRRKGNRRSGGSEDVKEKTTGEKMGG